MGYILYKDDVTYYLICVVGFGLILFWGNVIDLYYQSKLNNKVSAILKTIVFVVVSALKMVFVLLGLNVLYIGGIYTIEVIILFFGFMYLSKKNNIIENIKYSKDVAKNLLQRSWPYIITALTVGLYYRADQVMLKMIIGESEVGIYSASSVIATNIYFIPVVLTNVMMPILAQKKCRL